MYTSKMIANGWIIYGPEGQAICFLNEKTSDHREVLVLLSHLNRE